MPLWEYCEVAWTLKQITIHVYSGRADGSYEGTTHPNEWGGLLAQLGADGWELVGVAPTIPTNHTLYYSERGRKPRAFKPGMNGSSFFGRWVGRETATARSLDTREEERYTADRCSTRRGDVLHETRENPHLFG